MLLGHTGTPSLTTIPAHPTALVPAWQQCLDGLLRHEGPRLTAATARDRRDSSPAGSVPRRGNGVIPTKEESRQLSQTFPGHEIPRLRARNDTVSVLLHSARHG